MIINTGFEFLRPFVIVLMGLCKQIIFPHAITAQDLYAVYYYDNIFIISQYIIVHCVGCAFADFLYEHVFIDNSATNLVQTVIRQKKSVNRPAILLFF